MRALVVALAALAAAAAAAGTASGRDQDCEAVGIVCVGTLPSSHTTVALKSLHRSGVHGSAAITFGLHETKVVITLQGAPRGVRQAARIRRGGCFGSAGRSLGTVTNGQNFARIGPLPHVSGYSVVIRASAAPSAPIVACGVIPPHHHRR